MQKFYADAFFHRPPVVMGRQLYPLSLGHALLLQALGSPCITPAADRAPLNFHEAVPGIWFCSQPWKSGQSSIVSGSWEKDVALWKKSQKVNTTRKEATIKLIDSWISDLELFEEYLGVFVQLPPAGEVYKDGKLVKSRPCRVPWTLSVAWRLMERIDKDEVMNLPLTEALAWHACARDAAGDESLLSEAEDESNNVEPMKESSA